MYLSNNIPPCIQKIMVYAPQGTQFFLKFPSSWKQTSFFHRLSTGHLANIFFVSVCRTHVTWMATKGLSASHVSSSLKRLEHQHFCPAFSFFIQNLNVNFHYYSLPYPEQSYSHVELAFCHRVTIPKSYTVAVYYTDVVIQEKHQLEITFYKLLMKYY